MVSSVRRVGGENSETRELILNSAIRLISEKGYAAASTRRVAALAGVKPSLVHYYFPTTDDLLLAVSIRGAQESDRMLEEAVASENPLDTLWQFFTDPGRTGMAMEFMALANHRESVRQHMAEHSTEMRKQQVRALQAVLDKLGISSIPAEVLSVIMAGVGRVLVMEGALGVTEGHAETVAYVQEWLDQLRTKS